MLASIIFIINMSRAVVRRTHSGSDIFSKRIRPAKDVAVLQETGHERVVLQLEGVLFFGNADSLSEMVKRLFQKADMIALDMRAISDIDVSGANILAQLLSRSRALKKAILFCGVPAPLLGAVRALLRNTPIAEDLIKSDLDSALEWMEERSLFRHAGKRNPSDVLELREIDFLSGLDALEMDRVGSCLVLRQFAAGEVLCREGQEGDRMWLLAK